METQKENLTFVYFVVFAINLAFITTGTCMTWTSPSITKLPEILDDSISKNEENMVTSLLAIGGLIGSYPSAVLLDKLGRKKCLLILNIPQFLSYILIYFAHDVRYLYIARFLCGVSAASNFIIVPPYVAELSENSNRGALSCFLGLGATFGNLLMYIIGPYLSIRTTSLICLLPLVLFFILVPLCVPESSYFLLLRQREIAAKKSLMRLRRKNSSEIMKELHEINISINESSVKFKLIQFFEEPQLRKALIIGTALMFFQTFSGIGIICFHMQTIFETTGSNLSPELSAIYIGLVQFIVTLLTPFMIDRLGRCVMLHISNIGNAISLIVIGIFFYLKETHAFIDNILWLPMVSMIGYIIFFNLGMGPVPYTVVGEIFPSRAKAIASTLCTAFNFAVTFVVLATFPFLLETLGTAGTFWFYAFWCITCSLFVYMHIPETKGISFIAIQQKLIKN